MENKTTKGEEERCSKYDRIDDPYEDGGMAILSKFD